MDPAIPVSDDKSERIPPRARILAAAGELFYREGIRAVGIEAIAEAASTNKMTLYRHFASKDELVAEYLRERARLADTAWDRLAAAYPGDRTPSSIRERVGRARTGCHLGYWKSDRSGVAKG